MDSKRKQDISLALICIILSVSVSLLAVSLFMARAGYSGTEMTQTATQTVTINQRDEPPRVNINTATSHELMSFPGIGATLAERIIEARPFSDIWELADIDGIGGSTLQNIIERVDVQ